ncbi:MAG: ABC transporter substrate-binding protein [Clostridiaceae bacterium]
MKRRFLAATVATVLASSLLAGCGQSKTESDVIKIGYSGPLTGPVATYGVSVKQGSELAAEEINKAGGINGKNVEFVYEDDEADPAKATNAFNKLLDEKVVAILGGVTSGATIAIAPKATENKIPLLTPTATNPDVTIKGGEYAFRSCYLDSFQGVQLGKYAATDLKAKKVAVLYNNGDDYSKGIAEAFKTEYEKSGNKVVKFLTYNPKDQDFGAQLTEIKGENPDVILLPDYYNTVGLIAKQAREKGITAQFLGVDGWDSKDLTSIGGSAVNGAIFVNHYFKNDPDKSIQDFVKSYKDKYGDEPDALAALAYSGAKVLFNAIEKAGSTDGEKIKEALAATDMDTITGHIKFNDQRDSIKSAVLLKVNGDSTELVKKVEP